MSKTKKITKTHPMENMIESTPQPEFISDQQLFAKIWTSPREVFTYINDHKFEKYLYLLLILAGISRTFDRASLKNMGDNFSLWGVLAFCIIVGAIFGWITYYLYSALIIWTGKWLDGKGDTKSILRVLSFALIPSIAALLLLVPQIMIYGNEVFKSDGDITSGGLVLNVIVYSSMFLEFALGIWSLVLCVIAVSEVQKLSIGKSILNILLPVIVIMIPILIIIGIVFALN